MSTHTENAVRYICSFRKTVSKKSWVLGFQTKYILRRLRSGSPGYHVRAGCCSKHRSRRRHRVQRDRLLHVDAPSLRTLLDPRGEVIDSTANKYTAPQRQLSGIYNHAEDIHTRLEHLMGILFVSRFFSSIIRMNAPTDRHERKQVSGSVNSNEYEAYSSHGSMNIDIPVMGQHPCCQESRAENRHQDNRPSEIIVSSSQ